MKYFIIIISVFLLVLYNNSFFQKTFYIGKIIAVENINHFKDKLKEIPEKAVILLDVDDTLITPKAAIFRYSSPMKGLIDDIKADKENINNFEEIISKWRLSRKTILVEDEWPKTIEDLKTKYSVYALTKMEAGTIGLIPSMKEWRYDELSSKNIFFNEKFNDSSDAIILENKNSSAQFYKGFFITGAFKKGQVINHIYEKVKPELIILLDDREEQLIEALTFCKEKNIPFIGFLYSGVKNIQGEFDQEVAELQRKLLIEKALWLEDDEAKEYIANNKTD
jgi:hypothetical protein